MKLQKINNKNAILTFLAVSIFFSAACKAEESYGYMPPPNVNNSSFPNLNTPNANYSKYLDESDVYYKKGMEYYEQNEYTKAINFLQKALELSPERIKTRTNLSIIFINRGTYYFNKERNYASAASDYRNAIYYLKYDGYKLATRLADDNLRIAEENLKNVLNQLNPNHYDVDEQTKIAKALRGEGRFRESIVEYIQVLNKKKSKQEKIAEAIGDIYRALQKNKLAAKHYKIALSKKPEEASLHLKYAKSLQDAGNNNIAIKEFNIALKTCKEEQKDEILNALENIWISKIKENPRDAAAHMNLGVVLQKKNDLDGALREYQIAGSINPNDITTRLNLGTLYQEKKKYNIAIRAYNTILQVKPDHALTHYYKGTVLRDSGRLEEALAEFQAVLKIKPNDKMSKEALFETVKLFKDPADRNRILYTFASNNPRDSITQFKYAFYLHSENNFDRAMEYYHRTLKADPRYVDAYLNIAQIYKQKNNIPLAISVLEKAIKIMPENERIEDMITLIKSEVATVRYQYALQKHTNGEYDEAIKEYLNIISISEPNADLYVNLGAAYQAIENEEKAMDAYKNAIRVEDSNSTAYYYLGTAYFKQEKYEDALKAYQKAKARNPHDEKVNEAINASKQVITAKIIEKGIKQYNQGLNKEAMLSFNTALITSPDNAEIYYHRGMVYDAMKKYPMAISDYKLAIKNDPEFDIAYYALAVDYDMLNNFTEAKVWYNKFIENSDNPNDEYVRYSKQRVSQL